MPETWAVTDIVLGAVTDIVLGYMGCNRYNARDMGCNRYSVRGHGL